MVAVSASACGCKQVVTCSGAAVQSHQYIVKCFKCITCIPYITMEDAHVQSPRGTLRATCAQVLAVCALNWFPINVGLVISMPVIVIGALMADGSPLKFTEDDASWFGGLIYIMQPPGSIICGFLQDLIGRKTCFMLVCIPQFVSWLMLYFGSSRAGLFLASGTLGFTMGFMEAPLMSYISEITEPRLRDLLASVANVSFNVGILVLLFVGALVDWRTMVLISALGPVLAFISIAMVPDSPAWLVSRGRVKDAEKAFQWFRGWVSPEAVQKELEGLISFVQNNQKVCVKPEKGYTPVIVNQAMYKETTYTGLGIRDILRPEILQPMKMILLYFFTANCASLLPIRAFFIEILDSMNLPIGSLNVMAIGGVLTLLGSLNATFAMHHIGIRGLTFLSLTLCAASCLGIGVYLSLGAHLPWIPLTLVLVSFYAGPLGVLFIPWVLISELFPIRGKGFASGLTAAAAYLIMFMITKTYYSIVALVDVAGAFILYGTVGVLGIVYLFFNLPETEGISLEVIQALYAPQKTDYSGGEVEEEEKLRARKMSAG